LTPTTRSTPLPDFQGLVIDDANGANIAVTYKAEHAPLIALSPEMLAGLTEIAKGYNAGGKYSREGMQEIARALIARLS
jgi:hypothetical protein